MDVAAMVSPSAVKKLSYVDSMLVSLPLFPGYLGRVFALSDRRPVAVAVLTTFADDDPDITPREREVLTPIGQGPPNRADAVRRARHRGGAGLNEDHLVAASVPT
ncbi:hypothetical protein [Streptomyces niveus]|uniref:hypothetical protein n=1 Tax=Streptomyces niveus TaxID=193462 RepID=UPI00114D3043|nr:hypothetical protein [Streptomyces niveus]